MQFEFEMLDFADSALLGWLSAGVSAVGDGVGDGDEFRWLLNRAALFAELSVEDAFAVDALEPFVDGSEKNFNFN